MLGDGFLARRENIAIFSMTSLDEAYDLLAKSSNPLWTVEKWSKDDLLMGRFKGGEKPTDSAYHQEIALLLRAMQDECELQAVTSIGSEQLVGATGLLPGTVVRRSGCSMASAVSSKRPKALLERHRRPTGSTSSTSATGARRKKLEAPEKSSARRSATSTTSMLDA